MQSKKGTSVRAGTVMLQLVYQLAEDQQTVTEHLVAGTAADPGQHMTPGVQVWAGGAGSRAEQEGNQQALRQSHAAAGLQRDCAGGQHTVTEPWSCPIAK